MKIVAPDIEVYEKCGDEVIEPFYFSEPVEPQTCDSLIHHSKEVMKHIHPFLSLIIFMATIEPDM